MLAQLRPAIVMLVLFTALTGLAYPLAITGVAQLVLPRPGQRQPRRARRQGRSGSALIGQNFVSGRYFHGRPSATSAPDPDGSAKTVDAPYNAANSVRLQSWPDFEKARRSREVRHRGRAPSRVLQTPVAADAVTTSASGLDPHISPANMLWLRFRLSRRRGNCPRRASGHSSKRTRNSACLALIGEPRVNVLLLNLALDVLK